MKLNRLLTTVLLLVILLQIPCGAQADDLTVRYRGFVFPGDYTLTVPYDDGLFLVVVTAFVSAFYGATVSLPYVDSFFLHGFALTLLSALFVQASADSTEAGS